MSEVVKTRAARKPLTEFGASFRGFCTAVNQAKLAIKVGKEIGEEDSDKVASAIQSLIRKAGQNNGVVSVRSQSLVNAILKAVVELDPDLATKAETLRKNFQFEAISSANREPGQNWLVRLKAGEEVFLTAGHEGDAFYKLVKTREADPAE
jgi:hypothetical protein